MKSRKQTLNVEHEGKVIWKRTFFGKKTWAEAMNFIECHGLLPIQYTCCANGERIILASTEAEL